MEAGPSDGTVIYWQQRAGIAPIKKEYAPSLRTPSQADLTSPDTSCGRRCAPDRTCSRSTRTTKPKGAHRTLAVPRTGTPPTARARERWPRTVSLRRRRCGFRVRKRSEQPRRRARRPGWRRRPTRRRRRPRKELWRPERLCRLQTETERQRAGERAEAGSSRPVRTRCVFLSRTRGGLPLMQRVSEPQIRPPSRRQLPTVPCDREGTRVPPPTGLQGLTRPRVVPLRTLTRHPSRPPHHSRRPHSDLNPPPVPSFRLARPVPVWLQVPVRREPHAQRRRGERLSGHRMGTGR